MSSSMETDENKNTEEEEDDRVMKEVVAPPRFPLAHDKLFKKNGSVNLKVLVEHLNKEGRLELPDAISIVRKASALFKKEPNLLRLKDPLTVCGDVHGQFFDLLRLLEAGGDPTNTQYLFLGDYVDRGCFSCEVVLYLYSFKISFPKTFFMIRGNHECRHLTSFFNFKDECFFKYNEKLYDEIMESFDNLPIAATINNKFLCMHGGLSPDISTLDDISQINRFQEIPREGPFCDLLWADPVSTKGEDSDSDEGEDYEQPDTKWFAYNDTRQCSYIFGIEAVDAFLKRNKLTAIIRAHEAQSQGYKMQMINEATNIPRVITIFSAPNYCDVYGNKAACLKFDNELLNIRQFVFSPHPYYLPNFMDVFSWSLPFVAEKVTDMLAHVVNWSEEYPEEENKQDGSGSQIVQREHILRDKVKAISKMLKMYKTLRENTDLIVQLKQLTPNKALPTGVLAGGRAGIEEAITTFKEAKKADAPNERFPGVGAKPKKLKKDIVF